MGDRLTLVPVRFATARTFVDGWHRHARSTAGCVFCIGAALDDQLVAVCIVGRPVARGFDDGATLEVTRLATDGTRNGCSFLYGAAWRAARDLGYRRLITYTLATESGSSLRGAGWRVVGQRQPRPGWSTPSRPRDNGSYLSIERTLWEIA